jgi:WS/DGAT/MGAT family acyltransferase
MERLSRDDARILRLESESIAGHTLKLVVVGPGSDGRPLELAGLRTRVESRLQRLPRARQRLAATPLSIAPPAWIDDPGFDLRNHVRLAPEPVADRASLDRLCGRVMGERLDHARPLWCIDLAGPLESAEMALIVRIHHCLADGVTALRMLAALLWDEGEDGAPGPARSWRPRRPPRPSRLLAAGAAGRMREIGSGLAGAARAAGSPRRWRAAGSELGRLPATLRRELWPLGADTAFDRPIGGDREIAFSSCRLEELKRIERAAGTGVTVNDVVLALVAGAIRRWLGTHHEAMQTMRVQVPVSMHHRNEDQAELGNRDSFLFCDLPVSEPDPRVRLRAINAETASRKHHHDPDELYSFFHALSHIRPVDRFASRLATGPREFALAVSNVPGPREPVRLLGLPVSELYSVAEPADRHALRASAVSLAGRMGFGFCTDPGPVPGVAELAAGLDASLEELKALA